MRDVNDLVVRNILIGEGAGGRSTATCCFSLNREPRIGTQCFLVSSGSREKAIHRL